MFDIGFFELLVIAVVALLVIGPEQLPGTLRTLGLWVGRIKRGLSQARQEFEQQIGADDIRRQLHNEEVMRRLNASEGEIKRVVQENTQEIHDLFNQPATDQSSADTPTTHEEKPASPSVQDKSGD